MNWKVFITAFVSLALLALPQNAFTCGDSEDPYDYYTSFFNNRLGTGKEYEPFYYTSLLTLYGDNWESGSGNGAHINDRIAAEWKAYAPGVRLPDAIALVYQTPPAQLSALDLAISQGKPLPATLARNTLAQALAKTKKREAVAYLLFAKKTEPFAAVEDWAVSKNDSLEIASYLTEATKAVAITIDPFLKAKYAFQRCKLAFYSNRYTDCIRFYDEQFSTTTTAAVAELALSYKAGSLYRLGRKKEAAYAFSRAFPLSAQNKQSNFLGFLWSTDNCNPALVTDYTSLCKTKGERAAMLGMFAMYGTSYKLKEVQKVYELNPASPLLPLLASREISKLEEQYLTPLLGQEKGGRALYTSWRNDGWEEKTAQKGKVQAQQTAAFFESLAADKAVPKPALYRTGAAYLRFMTKDYSGAKALLANSLSASDEEYKDQAQLIQLLIAANEPQTIAGDREEQLLPALKWLVQKAKTDEAYRPFCRNFFSEILAQRYEQQDNRPRTALAYAVADLSFLGKETDNWLHYNNAIDYVQNNMNTPDLLTLYESINSPRSETEKFFVQNSSVKRDAVIDVIGTSHLRDRAYAKAVDWLSKAGKLSPLSETQYNYQTGKEKTVNVDPFFDYLNDWQRLDKGVQVAYTKLTLAKKLLELQTKIAHVDTVADKAKLYYTYASALYNMSQYGNSSEAITYYRSSVNWNTGSYRYPWEKEFFGVYEARNFYQKAYSVATDKEFKAACLFMVIKCAQRQVLLPEYDYKAEGASEKAAKAFDEKFRFNPLFANFKSEFGVTKFYRYAYNRCSYLRDFVKRSESTKVNPMR